MDLRFKTFAAAGLLATVACGGGDKTTGPVNPALRNGSMSARIDGNSWAASTALVAQFNGGILSIAGTDGSSRSVGFAVSTNTTAGTHTIGPTGPTNGLLVEGPRSWLAVGTQGSGSVTITSISTTRAVGTFTFTLMANSGSGATGSRSVTQGAFDVTY
jgi:hypothetical protein